MGTTLAMSSSYHPQTDGQSEALNKCLEMYLRCFVLENHKALIQVLPWASYWYNTAFHSSADITPVQIVYGGDPPQLLTYYSNEKDPLEVATLLQQREIVIA